MTDTKKSKMLSILTAVMLLFLGAITNLTLHVKNSSSNTTFGGDPVGPGGPQYFSPKKTS